MFHFFTVPLKTQRKRCSAIKWEKLKEKTAFVFKTRKYVTHTLIMRMSVLKVPGGSRWKLMEDAKPIKDNFSTPLMKRKPPFFRCKELNPKRLRFGENECSSVCHQPKSLFETSLLVVKASTSAVRRENIRLKTELKKTKDELKATKDKMRKTIFSVDTIRNNDKLCKHNTGFPNFCHNFSHFIAPYRFLWVFQGTLIKNETGFSCRQHNNNRFGAR